MNEDQSLWRGKVHHMQDQIKVKFSNLNGKIDDLQAKISGHTTELKKSFMEQLSVVQKTMEEKI